jgi:hypothetical protein
LDSDTSTISSGTSTLSCLVQVRWCIFWMIASYSSWASSFGHDVGTCNTDKYCLHGKHL